MIFNKQKALKALGMAGALLASLTLALSGQYVEAGGLLAAAFSSTSALSAK